jgi:16S rRNA (guanine1207-N2)-methyltransferase
MSPLAAPEPAPRALRLSLALDEGLALPDGPLGLFHPAAAEALPDLPRDRLVAITPHAADHAACAARGLATRADPPADGSLAAALVCLPRARAEGLDLIARAARATKGPVLVDGQKTDGIEAVLKALRERVDLSDPISKGHGKIAWFTAAPDALADWIAEPAVVDGFHTRPGLFSADGIDPASHLLAQALPAGAGGVAVDLGAGWGYLSAALASRAPGLREIHLVESDARALDCARANVTDPRARFHWADATRPVPGIRADLVITNPPFHTGRAATPALGAAFIATAAAMLNPGGALWLVANRHLPYEAALSASFRTVEEAGGSAAFKLYRATGPKSAAAPAPRRLRVRG